LFDSSADWLDTSAACSALTCARPLFTPRKAWRACSAALRRVVSRSLRALSSSAIDSRTRLVTAKPLKIGTDHCTPIELLRFSPEVPPGGRRCRGARGGDQVERRQVAGAVARDVALGRFERSCDTVTP
jgi:hypothetical protein